ncbi:shadow of prion protein 2 [Rhinichthys klamathensis goyatoka]|uniref:shadow of prion protein 2 n=1 Tax=Rhinichthys klamathensis goyatoka TaxID=3034132 RepID=UPI0024B50E59|nr:shadow of prion protein 2 [Rhinichthys klamathensis goyatoka]
MGNQKLLVMWVWMLLVVSLYPLAHCKRRGGSGGRGGVGKLAKAPSQNKGLKLAGAAAAGALGGAAIGYGLGSLGRPRYEYEGGSRRYYPDGPGNHSRSDRENYRNTGSSGQASILITLGTVAHIFMWG